MDNMATSLQKSRSATKKLLEDFTKKRRLESPKEQVQSPMKLKFIIVLCASISTFVCMGEWEPTWSTRAAEEAEAVAAIPCSGHGRAYLDGLILTGHEPVCECNPCYGGSDCFNFLSDCSANASR